MDPETVTAIYLETYNQGVEDMLADWNYSDWLPDGVKKTTTSIDDRRVTGLMHVRWFMRDAVENDWQLWRLPDGSPGVEIGFRLEFGNVPVVGYIDSVLVLKDGSLAPLDYKSKDSDQPDQLGLYSLVLRECFEEDSRVGFFWRGQLPAPRKGHEDEERRPKGLTDPIDLSRYTREYFTQMFTEMDAGVRAGCFIPNSGSHCRVCPVQSACRAMGKNALYVSES